MTEVAVVAEIKGADHSMLISRWDFCGGLHREARAPSLQSALLTRKVKAERVYRYLVTASLGLTFSIL